MGRGMQIWEKGAPLVLLVVLGRRVSWLQLRYATQPESGVGLHAARAERLLAVSLIVVYGCECRAGSEGTCVAPKGSIGFLALRPESL